jgi:hypothetical protein
VRQVQRQDDTGLREHRIRGAVPQQARVIYTHRTRHPNLADYIIYYYVFSKLIIILLYTPR